MPRSTFSPLPLSNEALERIDSVARKLRGGGGASDTALADAVRGLSHAYTRDRARLSELDATREALWARAAFFLPRELPKVFGPLDDLLAAGRFPAPANNTLKLLDVGAGLGATSLGVARWLKLRRVPVERLEVVALERNAPLLRGLRLLTEALASLPNEFVPVKLDARAIELERADLSGSFDLITFGFVLNELYADAAPPDRAMRKAELLIDAGRRLRAGGALVVLEPALKESARELMAVRDQLAGRSAAPFVIAPCMRKGCCPMLASERDWCHQDLAYALPPRLAAVARAAALRYEGLSYASLVLANEPRGDDPPFVYRVVSDPLESKGKLELFGCGEAGYVRLTRLMRHATADNAPFAEARRGDVLSLDTADFRISETTSVQRRGSMKDG